ncbi:MAG: DUF58 domain-containing protein [Chloroflexota bacterium]
MSRSIFLGLLVYLLLLWGLASVRGELLALTAPLVLFLLIGFWRAPHEMKLDIQRTLSAERVAPGAPVTVTLTVTNRGATLDEVLLEDVLPPPLSVTDGSNRHLVHLPAGKSAAWTYTVSGPRGYYPLAEVRAEASDLFGLSRREGVLETSGQLFILPPILRLRHIPIRPRRTRVYAGSIPARAGGAGVDFFGVREYRDGDSPRAINWRVSARHTQALFANEYEQERVSDVGIVLDGRERTNHFGGGRSLFEHSVSAAAALADAFLNQGNRVGLLLYSNYLQWTLPGYGKLQRERILHTLSQAHAGPSQVFADLDHIPTKLFSAQSQIVVVSPLTADDLEVLIQLRARGYQVMVVSPDPVSFELQNLRPRAEVALAARVVRLERDLLLRRLQRAGIRILDWNVLQPFDQAMRRMTGRWHAGGAGW